MSSTKKRAHGEKDDPYGLAIPIAVLLVLLVIIREVWLLIPLVILVIAFARSLLQEREISRGATDIDYWKAPDAESAFSSSDSKYAGRKSIYESQREKEQGITAGALVPIAILTLLFFLTGVVWFMIPIAVLVISLLGSEAKTQQNQSRVIRELETGEAKTVDDAAKQTGLPEDKVRRHIVEGKRKGETNVWFDSDTGTKTTSPVKVTEPETDTADACIYCGFKLKEEDRFCPYCGAPIKAE